MVSIDNGVVFLSYQLGFVAPEAVATWADLYGHHQLAVQTSMGTVGQQLKHGIMQMTIRGCSYHRIKLAFVL